MCALVIIVSVVTFFRDVDDVHDLMDDIQEQNEVATEISDALSQPIGFNQEIDDVSIGLSCGQGDNYYSVDSIMVILFLLKDDLLAELEEMEQETLDEQLLDV